MNSEAEARRSLELKRAHEGAHEAWMEVSRLERENKRLSQFEEDVKKAVEPYSGHPLNQIREWQKEAKKRQIAPGVQ